MTRLLYRLLLFITLTGTSHAAEPLRIGAVAFGTLNWELATIKDYALDAKHGIELQPQTLTNPQAGSVALMADSVDLIVSDWIWVSRQRETGGNFSFVPYSSNHGVLLVPVQSPITKLSELAGKRLGVAGGGLDKNWLLLLALAKDRYGLDLEHAASVAFGAPPLLNEQLQQGKLDAVLNFWHYAAKLEAKGYRPLLSGSALMEQLGVDADVPSLGYVFRESWAQQHPAALKGFLAASQEAKQLLCESDEAWQKVQPLTQEQDTAVLANLRLRYCEGRIRRWGDPQKKAVEHLYALLKRTGGPEAAGKAPNLAPGTFWPYPVDNRATAKP